MSVPNGTTKFPITLAVARRVLQADLNAKSLRRCVAAINAAGPNGVSVISQGKLEGDTLLKAKFSRVPVWRRRGISDHSWIERKRLHIPSR